MSKEYEVRKILGSKMCLLKDDPGISSQLMKDENREWDAPLIVKEIVKEARKELESKWM